MEGWVWGGGWAWGGERREERGIESESERDRDRGKVREGVGCDGGVLGVGSREGMREERERVGAMRVWLGKREREREA
ncbi:unnamed protein product [Prunus armeniaca]